MSSVPLPGYTRGEALQAVRGHLLLHTHVQSGRAQAGEHAGRDSRGRQPPGQVARVQQHAHATRGHAREVRGPRDMRVEEQVHRGRRLAHLFASGAQSSRLRRHVSDRQHRGHVR